MDNFNINDPKNIIGLSALMGDDDTQIDSLEKEIINGAQIEEEQDNLVKEFESEMDRLNTDFNIANLESLNDGQINIENSNNLYDTNMTLNDETSEQENNAEQFNTMSYDNNISYDKNNSYDRSNNNFSSKGNKVQNYNSTWSSSNPEDSQLKFMTIEEKKQNYIKNVLNDLDNEDEGDFNIDKEREEDDKNSLLEQIDMLRMTLEDEGIDISNVPIVNKNNNTNDIQNVYKILRLKNDRNRYCSFAEECILSVAYGMEFLFDGKKEWFGRRPDLIGWPQTVKVKLRRMRYETSTFVQEVMQEYHMSSGVRLMIELIPSMFLYSRQRKAASNGDNLYDGNQYNDAISNLNSQFS